MTFALKAATQEIRALADLLIATSVSTVVTYPQLSAISGKDIQQHRYLLARALIIASREAGVVFQNIRSVGYQRLPGAEVYQLGAHARQRVRRTTNRASTAIKATVSMTNDLDNAALLKALREMSALDLLRQLATDKIMRKIPNSVKPLSIGETLAAVVDQLNSRPKKSA